MFKAKRFSVSRLVIYLTWLRLFVSMLLAPVHDLLTDRTATGSTPRRNAIARALARLLREQASRSILARLLAASPLPEIYQPLDIQGPVFNELAPVRNDAQARFDIMRSFVDKYIGPFNQHERTYIDIGCNTGFFCKRMAEIGFKCIGLDSSRATIDAARVADRYFHKTSTHFIHADAASYIIHNMKDHDVVSAFSVFQWMFLQADRQFIYDALLTSMNRARCLFFFEIAYAEESFYKGDLSMREPLNRKWCFDQLAHGGFDKIVLCEKGDRGLLRDFFIGIRNVG